MSEPKHRPTDEQPAVTPTVSTDPARSRWHWSAVPSHLGRARTSTVVLSLLFLGIGALYLYIRPDTVAPTTAGTTGGVVQTTPTPTRAAPTTTAPRTTAAPTTTADRSTAPTTAAPTDTSLPTDTSAPTDTTGSTSTLPTLTPPTTTPDTTPSSPTP
jgi:hypothetical protein